ncbi:MAG: hypothetical protein ACTSQI_18365 [Candidatus Helarchaeota archaeon]
MPPERRKTLPGNLFIVSGLAGVAIAIYGLNVKPFSDIFPYFTTSIIIIIIGALDVMFTCSNKYYKLYRIRNQNVRIILGTSLTFLGSLLFSLPFWFYRDLFFALTLIPLEILLIGFGFLFIIPYQRKK